MKDYLIGFCRIIVGSLFIFSGLIKANDPLGFSYKLEEYWIEFGMNWDWLISIGPTMASIICILEIVLGIAILIAFRVKLVSRLLLFIMVFFTILTFASAVFGLVKTCGCFGDAFPLTPWQSFIKDIVLIVLVLVINSYSADIKPYKERYKGTAFVIFPTVIMAFISNYLDWNFPLYFTMGLLIFYFLGAFVNPEYSGKLTVALSLIGSVWVCYYSLNHLPMKDFRPYAIGKSIVEQMHLPEGAKPDVYKNVFKYKNKNTGEVESFDDSNYPWDDENYEFVDRITSLVEKGDEAKITDFSIVDSDGSDITEDILNDQNPILVVISSNTEKACKSNALKLSELVKSCNQEGVSVIGLSASNPASVKKYTDENDLEMSFYATDEITLKTIVRSNPGLILLRDGVVEGKWHINDVPVFAELLVKD